MATIPSLLRASKEKGISSIFFGDAIVGSLSAFSDPANKEINIQLVALH
jgi:hypothetical protein